MRNQFVKTVSELIKEDPSLYLMLGDIGVWGFRDILEKYPERAKNMGICEQATVGVAAGLSISEYIPIVHTIAPFLVERAYEQLKLDFGYQQLNGNFVSVGGSYEYDKLGYSHHCPADVSLLYQIPNMEIMVPGTAQEFDTLFRRYYRSKNPTYYRLSKYVNDESYDTGQGQSGVLPLRGEGKDFTVLVVGPALRCWDKVWEEDKFSVNILYTNRIRPLDLKIVAEYCPSSRLLLIEPYYGVLGSILTEDRYSKAFTTYSASLYPSLYPEVGVNQEEIIKAMFKE